MLIYKLKEIKDDLRYYTYKPDVDETAFGIVAFHLDGSAEIIQDSKVDVKRYYAMHAISGINTSKDSGIVAWC